MAKQDIPLIGPILNRIIGTRNDRFVKRYLQRVKAIGALDDRMRPLTDEQLRAKTEEFRVRIDKGEKVDDVMIEAFAVAREAMDRAIGIRNIINPAHNFDPSRLSAAGRALYERVKAEAEATPPAEPDGEWNGCAEPQPGWRQVSIPAELYQEVRTLYPESRPPYRSRPFDVQLIGGMVLAQGKISEMKTGEGKTIVGPLAAYLACLERMKVHVVTVNDYLVQRDRDWVFPFFHALGLTVGAIHPQHMQPEDQKRRMYRCDVVYGTTAEFGFDYLRDNMKRSADQQVQRVRQFAIVDEVDSILIDEARTPLIISGPAHEGKPRYELADQLARHLVNKQQPWQEAEDRVDECQKLIKGLEGDIRNARDKARIPDLQRQLKEAVARLPRLQAEKTKHVQYYETHLERRAVHITHAGVAEAQRVANIGSFYVGQNMDVPHLLEQSLKAHVVFQRDRDYIVSPQENPNTGRVEPSILIVDVNTGRPMVGRQWSDGLHQACEAKEGVPIKQENQTVASITIQNFFKMYKRLAGMTGTADTEAQEFHDIYKLDVVGIPTNRLVSRRDFDDMVFLTGKDKWAFITDEIKAFHDVGRPVLVGTTSVEKSETLSQMLTKRHGVKHDVLNAKQHEREAHIVEHAGELGQVMIATNMAGRGTDIKLSPITREMLLDHWLRRSICPATVTVDSTDEQLREGVYRKIAPQELGLPKRDVEQMPFAELELKLLRHWAQNTTWLTDKDLNRAGAEELRKAIDQHGRFLLHRLRWFSSIEEMGGLHVVGTERHESRRIDNQLRGRSGRQGDKGSSRFFISLDDELMKLFAGETTMKILSRLGMKEGDAIEHPILSKSVERAQRKVEERNFQIRKNILEYDEVMEHQRRAFYGLRQRVLEGRDVKGLIFEYIRDATRDAIKDFLDPGYASGCIAEYVRQKTDCAINSRSLRGLEGAELVQKVRAECGEELRAQIDITLGEYMPADDDDEPDRPGVDFDAAGLMNWARDRFGVELSATELAEGGAEVRRMVLDRLSAAADEKLEQADLTDLDKFLAPDFGARELCTWSMDKYGIEVSPEQVRKAQNDGPEAVEKLFLERAQAMYRQREIEYPVEFMMEMTMGLMRQSPAAAMGQLIDWANRRYGLNWGPDTVRTMTPQVTRERLLAASKQFVEGSRLEEAVKAALACPNDAALAEHLRTKYNVEMPEHQRLLDRDTAEEREHAVRARVETVMRAELIYFERTLVLEVFDDIWKQHLYTMDQLRDGINFRSMAQQDPRIEFKREGSRLFNEMMQTVRDRVTDYIFKVKLTPQVAAPAARPMAPMGPMGAPAAAMPAGRPTGGGVLSGPMPGAPVAARPMPVQQPMPTQQGTAADMLGAAPTPTVPSSPTPPPPSAAGPGAAGVLPGAVGLYSSSIAGAGLEPGGRALNLGPARPADGASPKPAGPNGDEAGQKPA
jgi:preprotein translocase subunit SecA